MFLVYAGCNSNCYTWYLLLLYIVFLLGLELCYLDKGGVRGNLLQSMAFERLDQVGRGLWVPKSPWGCPLGLVPPTTPECWTPFLLPRCDLWVYLLIKKNLSIPYSELVWDYLILVPPIWCVPLHPLNIWEVVPMSFTEKKVPRYHALLNHQTGKETTVQ